MGTPKSSPPVYQSLAGPISSLASGAYTREHNVEIVTTDFVPPADEITTDDQAGSVRTVVLHDGAVRLRKLADDYDPTDRDRAYAYIRERQVAGEILTGLLYILPRFEGRPRPERHRPRAADGTAV